MPSSESPIENCRWLGELRIDIAFLALTRHHPNLYSDRAIRCADCTSMNSHMTASLIIQSLTCLTLAQPALVSEIAADPQPEGHIGPTRDDHLAPLAHFPHGEWRTVPANDNDQRDIWNWGPGKHALTSITTNKLGTSESTFGSFRVIYHHPHRDELTVLALCGPGLMQTGTLTPLDDGDLRFDMILFYDQEAIAWAPEPTRTIASVWFFDGPTSYTNRWITDQGQPVEPAMTNWSFVKADDLTPLPPSAHEPPSTVNHLDAFLPLIESAWVTESARTTLKWIPYNEAIHMRTLDTSTDMPIAETIIYPHPHTKAIHTLTIHDSGAIDEGLAIVEDDAILIRASRFDQNGITPIEKRIDRLGPDSIRIRTRSGVDPERTRLAETTLQAATDSSSEAQDQ